MKSKKQMGKQMRKKQIGKKYSKKKKLGIIHHMHPGSHVEGFFSNKHFGGIDLNLGVINFFKRVFGIEKSKKKNNLVLPGIVSVNSSNNLNEESAKIYRKKEEKNTKKGILKLINKNKKR